MLYERHRFNNLNSCPPTNDPAVNAKQVATIYETRELMTESESPPKGADALR